MQAGSDAAEMPLPLVFERPIAIVGGGRVEPDMLRDLDRQGVALVGADGGGDVIGAAGLTPAAIIGDLDSLRDVSEWAGRTRLVHLEEQDTTDFDKAVYSTRAPVTLALGMIGKRFDHTMAGLHVVQRYAATRPIVMVDEVDLVLARIGAFAFEASAGERVSIHPLEAITFRASAGLKYPLAGKTLSPDGMTGVSNAATGGPVSIEPGPGENGVWLLMLERSRLWDVVAALCAQVGANESAALTDGAG